MTCLDPVVLDYARLAALAGYQLDSPQQRAELDAVAAGTAADLDMPISLVTVVLDSAQLFLGSSGVTGWLAEAGGMPAEWAFCTNVVASGKPYVVNDAPHDPEHHDNPLVVMDGVTSYAGVPLVGPDGHVLGAHCVISSAPREFGCAEYDRLRDGAASAIAIMERFRGRPA